MLGFRVSPPLCNPSSLKGVSTTMYGLGQTWLRFLDEADYSNATALKNPA